MSPPAPASPCVRICTLDERGECMGCGRSLDEIARWASMSRQEQWSVIDRLERRRREQSATEAAQ